MKNSPVPKDSVHLQALDWLIRIHSNTISEAECQVFEDWLAEDSVHTKAYMLLEDQWQWMEDFKDVDFPARTAALKYRKSKSRLYKYIIAVIVMSVIGLGVLHPSGWIGMPHTYMTAKGENKSIDLADGSRLNLNTETEIRVHLNYWQRNVELIKGEVFFSVAHNADRPFQVQVNGAYIRDIGTAFNIYIKPAQVTVAVEEGEVEVKTASKLRLIAGQQLAFNDTGTLHKLQTINIAELAAWRSGNIIFHDKRLDEVLADIVRYQDKHIHLQNERLAELKISGTFHIAKLNDMLSAISAILPVTVQFVGDREIIIK